MPKRIISFSGRKHSGKTELCNLCEEYGYTIINFADALKNLIMNSLDITRSTLEEYKDVVFEKPFDLTNEKINYIANEISINYTVTSETLQSNEFYTIRKFMQVLGTDLIRKYNPLWHINKIKEILQKNPDTKYCIGDTRFLNEKSIVEEFEGECWFIIRSDTIDISNHYSEIDLKWINFDNNIIVNTDKNILWKRWKNYLTTCNYTKINPLENVYNTAFLTATKENAYLMGYLLSCSDFTQKEHVELFEKILGPDYITQLKTPFVIENLKLWNYCSVPQEIPYIIQNNLDLQKYWIAGLLKFGKDSFYLESSELVLQYIYDLIGNIGIMKDSKLIFYKNEIDSLYKWLNIIDL